MANQDEIARQLTRINFEDTTHLLFQLCTSPRYDQMLWDEIIVHPTIDEYLRGCGWTINEFVSECKNCKGNRPHITMVNMFRYRKI